MRSVACIIVAVFVGSAASGKRPQPVAPVSKPYGVDMPLGLSHTSAASCSASACHGGGQPGRFGSEHTSWAPQVRPHGEFDPHSDAYRVLFNEVSVRIAKAIGGGTAHENILCLKCHAPAGVKQPEARSEGVGCSACHGPSEKWIDSHYLPEWKAKTNREKWHEGFVPTKNLTARISNCAICHVGSSDREVNHDLIAAGHPRLAFEYTRFHFSASYGKHWEEKTLRPEFEVRAWLIGQATTARAAVDVLHGRAVKAESNLTPWPEFAGLSCYSCHKGVGEKPDRGSKGTPGWEMFHTAALDIAAVHSDSMFAGLKSPELRKLNELKAKMNSGTARPAEIAPLAAAARAELDAWLASIQRFEEANPRTSTIIDSAMVLGLAREAVRTMDWDTLAAHYLGAAAMHHASGGGRVQPLVRKPLEAIYRELKFPDGFNSPKGFDPVKVHAGFRDLFDAAVEEKRR